MNYDCLWHFIFLVSKNQQHLRRGILEGVFGPDHQEEIGFCYIIGTWKKIVQNTDVGIP
jgi:hypothetical protein